MGVHVGQPRTVRDPMTRRVEFIGPVVNAAARITALTHGGQIVLSEAAFTKVKDSEMAREDRKRMICLGKFEMPDAPRGVRLFELKPRGLEGRFFGGITLYPNKDSDQSSSASGGINDGSAAHSDEEEQQIQQGAISARATINEELQAVVGEGMMFKEDNFLTSANLCRWVIDFNEIALGKQVGLGSYGVVYKGKWKGVEVAAKKFLKQKLDERRMLEFRAEMAFLAELHHPNIVLFIGACVKRPNLCIVTEFVKNGSLHDLLRDTSVKLSWRQRVRMLRSAALGINYLHSLHPVIVHRDLKPSNLLVDENMNVKVADFGFARIKEENATMTRCGTPCWTAPEVIRGEKYSEKADVFSFGIIMWEVLTRKQPFAGRNFMGVSLDVLEGRRPAVPGDCLPAFKKLMKKCWHGEADKRPSMEDVVTQLDAIVGEDETTSA